MTRIIKLAIASIALTAAAAQAAPIVDGILSAADGYGAPVKIYADSYLNGATPADGTNAVSTYFTFDDAKVYGVVQLDSGPKAFPGANVYLYSSGSATPNNTTGAAGVYGDGNDIIAEGANGWAYSTPVGGATPVAPYNPATVNYIYNSATDTVEFSIARSLLGDYSTFRYGGQFFSYEFHRGSGDRVPGALVSVPEPTTLAALAGMGVLGLRRRRA